MNFPEGEPLCEAVLNLAHKWNQNGFSIATVARDHDPHRHAQTIKTGRVDQDRHLLQMTLMTPAPIQRWRGHLAERPAPIVTIR